MVSVGAILIAGDQGSFPCGSGCYELENRGVLPLGPICRVELLGRTVLYHIVQSLKNCGVSAITILDDFEGCNLGTDVPSSLAEIERQTDDSDIWAQAATKAGQLLAEGIDRFVLMRVGACFEIDCDAIFDFHQSHHQPISRLYDKQGPLDAWVFDSRHMPGAGSLEQIAGSKAEIPCESYLLKSYSNRLSDAHDFRRFVVDAFLSRSSIRPSGKEVRPGVWIGKGASVHGRARVVAPAYIGEGTTLSAASLVTRHSNIERGCFVDYGTVVEDASILANTYLGTGLDISHAVVNGSELMNLQHDISMHVADPCLVSENEPTGTTLAQPSSVHPEDNRSRRIVNPKSGTVEARPLVPFIEAEESGCD